MLSKVAAIVCSDLEVGTMIEPNLGRRMDFLFDDLLKCYDH